MSNTIAASITDADVAIPHDMHIGMQLFGTYTSMESDQTGRSAFNPFIKVHTPNSMFNISAQNAFSQSNSANQMVFNYTLNKSEIDMNKKKFLCMEMNAVHTMGESKKGVSSSRLNNEQDFSLMGNKDKYHCKYSFEAPTQSIQQWNGVVPPDIKFFGDMISNTTVRVKGKAQADLSMGAGETVPKMNAIYSSSRNHITKLSIEEREATRLWFNGDHHNWDGVFYKVGGRLKIRLTLPSIFDMQALTLPSGSSVQYSITITNHDIWRAIYKTEKIDVNLETISIDMLTDPDAPTGDMYTSNITDVADNCVWFEKFELSNVTIESERITVEDSYLRAKQMANLARKVAAHTVDMYILEQRIETYCCNELNPTPFGDERNLSWQTGQVPLPLCINLGRTMQILYANTIPYGFEKAQEDDDIPSTVWNTCNYRSSSITIIPPTPPTPKIFGTGAKKLQYIIDLGRISNVFRVFVYGGMGILPVRTKVNNAVIRDNLLNDRGDGGNEIARLWRDMQDIRYQDSVSTVHMERETAVEKISTENFAMAEFDLSNTIPDLTYMTEPSAPIAIESMVQADRSVLVFPATLCLLGERLGIGGAPFDFDVRAISKQLCALQINYFSEQRGHLEELSTANPPFIITSSRSFIDDNIIMVACSPAVATLPGPDDDIEARVEKYKTYGDTILV